MDVTLRAHGRAQSGPERDGSSSAPRDSTSLTCRTSRRVGAGLAALAGLLALMAAACGDTTITITPTPTAVPSRAAAATPAPAPRHGALTDAPGYGTDGSIVTVVVTGAQPGVAGSVALCSVTPTGALAACDPNWMPVGTDANGGFAVDYTIGQVPGAVAPPKYVIAFRDGTGALLAQAPFNPDLPTPSPTPAHPTATPKPKH